MASIPGGVGAHHRHIHPYNNNNKDEQKHHSSNKQDEQSPLVLLRHFSMAEEPPQEGNNLTRMYHRVLKLQPPQVDWKHWGFLALFFLLAAFSLGMVFRNEYGTHQILRIEHAREHFVSVDDGIQIWFRTWGNRQQGIPILFVHGGPGNAIADYNNGNQEFFDYRKYFVVEVDQRGTGQSQPSVRDSWRNMEKYKDISIDVVADDFEVVRKSLNIDQWLVWGGSFGSTLAINYGIRYPHRCLALILRGIYLDTEPEVRAVYSQDTYTHNPKRLAEYKILFKYANEYVERNGEDPMDPNDSERLLRTYEHMIRSGDKYAIWHWHVFENNLMEEEPENLLDPNRIDPNVFPEAQSVAFFETRFWVHSSYEHPSELLSRVHRLTQLPVWICQGRRDEVCPDIYARHLVDALDDEKAIFTARFVDAGHEQTDPIIAECLKESLYDFERQFSISQERRKVI